VKPDDDLAPVRPVDVTRVSGSRAVHEVDAAATEEPLDIRLHGQSFAVIMRTPGLDRALAAGFLLSERIIRTADDLGAVEHCRHPDHRRAHHVVDVFLVGDAASRVPQMLDGRRALIANSSCGVCGRATIDELRRDITPIDVQPTADLAFLQSLPARLRDTQRAFDETGGLHGAAIFSRHGQLLSSAEDVGRHNAVDKAIGGALLARRPITGLGLLVTGRISAELAFKAARAGIAWVATPSVPSTLAVEIARRSGMTLVGRAVSGEPQVWRE
jgi:FdhD protein